MKQPTRNEQITDWVIENFGDSYLGPNHSQFSAVEVTNIINSYIKAINSGTFKIKK